MNKSYNRIILIILLFLMFLGLYFGSCEIINRINNSTVKTSTSAKSTDYKNSDKLILIKVSNKGKKSTKLNNINLKVANKTAEILKQSGYSVKVIDKKSKYKYKCILSLDITGKIDSKNADKSGISAVYNKKGNKNSKMLADSIIGSLVKNTKALNRGIFDNSSVGDDKAPNCVINTGYISNSRESKLLQDKDYQIKLAIGIATGIEQFFKDEKAAPKPASSEANNSDKQSSEQLVTSENKASSITESKSSSADKVSSNIISSNTRINKVKQAMYLTFDDGPSNEHTKKILRILKANNIKATFFLVGSQVKKYPEIAKAIVADGHTIGIHCYDHDYYKIYKSTKAYYQDFIKARRIIKKVTGLDVKLYRFPGGSKNSFNRRTYNDIIKHMTAKGYVYYDWNAILGDAGICKNAKQVIEYTVKNVPAGRDVVMLGHDAGAKGNTPNALQAIIDQFSDDFYFKSITNDTIPVTFANYY